MNDPLSMNQLGKSATKSDPFRLFRKIKIGLKERPIQTDRRLLDRAIRKARADAYRAAFVGQKFY